MNLTYNQSRRVEKVITDYSRALGFETAKQYIDTIVGSAIAVAEKVSVPQNDAFSAIIKELKHYYKTNVAPTNSEEKATEVLITLQSQLNSALKKKKSK